MLGLTEQELLNKMYVSLLSIDATQRRIMEIMETTVRPKREPRKPKVELTEAQWQAKMIEMYPNYDVPQLLRDAEAHYVSLGDVMTRDKGAAWLRRQVKFHKPVSVPEKKRGLVL